MEFQGKTALITGAANGIGRATAILMGQRGANLILVDMNTEKLETVKEELGEAAQRTLCYGCDISDNEAVKKLVAEAEAHFGGIDILVNNAALWRYFHSFLDTPIEQWKLYTDVNIMGLVHFCHAVLGGMLERKYGRIINIASVAGVYGNAGMVMYSATKGAVISFSKALAKEVAHLGVTVNAVSPGSVSPSENPDIHHTVPSELAFMGRTGSHAENAELICFLASERAAYISAQNIQIDGCRKKQ